MPTRRNIYIPPALDERLAVFPDINVSEVCQRALDAAVDERVEQIRDRVTKQEAELARVEKATKEAAAEAAAASFSIVTVEEARREAKRARDRAFRARKAAKKASV